MQEARVRITLALLGLLALASGGFALYSARHTQNSPVIITDSPTAEPTDSAPPAAASITPLDAPEAAPSHIFVDVSGAVRRPWLYALPTGSRVMKAVLAAGGPVPQADLDAVNLAEPLKDGEKVYIPLKKLHAAVTVPTVPPGNVIGYAPVTHNAPAPPTVLPTILEPAQTAPVPVGTLGKSKTKSGSKGDKITSPSQGQIALNTADATQLERLPGVGPAMAARILAFRDQAHGFQSLGELQEVGGVGPKKFAKIVPFVTLN